MKRALIFLSIFLTLVSAPMVRAETAAPLTDQYIAAIRVGCSNALQSILQVQKSEAASRVNRGREYETILRLLAAFNGRVVLNKLDASALIQKTSQIQQRFSQFNDNYLAYADRIDETLKVNCQEAPVTFYDSLSTARDAREAIARDVKQMDTLLNEYQAHLDNLKASLNQGETQ